MKITIKMLEDADCCEPGIEIFKKTYRRELKASSHTVTLARCLRFPAPMWFWWLIPALLKDVRALERFRDLTESARTRYRLAAYEVRRLYGSRAQIMAAGRKRKRAYLAMQRAFAKAFFRVTQEFGK